MDMNNTWTTWTWKAHEPHGHEQHMNYMDMNNTWTTWTWTLWTTWTWTVHEPHGHEHHEPHGHEHYEPHGHEHYEPHGHEHHEPHGHEQHMKRNDIQCKVQAIAAYPPHCQGKKNVQSIHYKLGSSPIRNHMDNLMQGTVALSWTTTSPKLQVRQPNFRSEAQCCPAMPDFWQTYAAFFFIHSLVPKKAQRSSHTSAENSRCAWHIRPKFFNWANGSRTIGSPVSFPRWHPPNAWALKNCFEWEVCNLELSSPPKGGGGGILMGLHPR